MFTDYATRFLLSSGGIDTLSMSTWSAKTQRACSQPHNKLRRLCQYTIWLPVTTKTLTRHFINLKLFSVHDFNIITIVYFRQTKPSYQLVQSTIKSLSTARREWILSYRWRNCALWPQYWNLILVVFRSSCTLISFLKLSFIKIFS